MKTITLGLMATTVLLFAASCNSNTKETTETAKTTESTEITTDSIKTYNYCGTYEGVLPAADCEGIKTLLILNDDTTYDLISEYLKEGESPIETCGVYSVKNENLVELITPSSGKKTYYKIIENAVVLSDSIGTVNEGEMADLYILKKK